MSRVEENFESAVALLMWSGKDLDSLQRSVERFFLKQPYVEVTEFNPDTGKYDHKLRLTRKPPDTWRRLVFRTVCDLRHCIDQAMFAAVQTVLGAPPEEDIYFPWSKSPTDLIHRRKKIPQVLWRTLSTLEPYPRGDDYSGGDDTIYAIRNAAGPNKHRIAIRPEAGPVGWSFKGSADGDWRIPFDGWDGSKNEFTIIKGLPPGGKRNYTVEFVLNISFGDVEGLARKPVIPVLDHFGRYAQFVIVRLMEDSAKIAGL